MLRFETGRVELWDKSKQLSADSVGLALNYPRAGVTGVEPAPDGWAETESLAVFPGAVEDFDELADLLLDFRIHERAGMRSDPVECRSPLDVRLVRSGPLAGYVRLVDVVDEVLSQGFAWGTGEDNQAVAEHRVVLDFDPDAGRVSVCARTVWQPRGDFVLPGGGRREAWAHRRLVERITAATRAAARR